MKYLFKTIFNIAVIVSLYSGVVIMGIATGLATYLLFFP